MKRRRLDSDDDDDEYVGGSEAGLSMYPISSSHNDVMLDMGLASSDSSVRRDSAERGDDIGSDVPAGNGKNVRVAAALAASERQRPARHKPTVQLSSQVRVDEDVPGELNGLLSDALLAAYCVPLQYACSRRAVDDKLLAQYTPSSGHKESPAIHYCGALDDSDEDSEADESVIAKNSGIKDTAQRGRFRNVFGIPPGWRWDGVVRGRKVA